MFFLISNHLQLTSSIFNGLANLETLYLDKVNTKQGNLSLPVNLFIKLKGLKVLSLAENNLEEIQTNLFDPMPRLEKLNLAKNCLSKLASQTFMGLKKLKFLDLSENKLSLKVYGTLANLSGIVVLNLAYNSISRIDEYTFKGMNCLESLCLRKNNFGENFRIDSFERISKCLNQVDLSEMPDLPQELKEKLAEHYKSKIDFIFED